MPNKVKKVSGFPSKLKGLTKLPVSEDGAVVTQEVNGNTIKAPGSPRKVNGMASSPGRTRVAADTPCKVKDKAKTQCKVRGAVNRQERNEEVDGLPGIEAETNTLYDHVKMRDGRRCKIKDMATGMERREQRK